MLSLLSASSTAFAPTLAAQPVVMQQRAPALSMMEGRRAAVLGFTAALTAASPAFADSIDDVTSNQCLKPRSANP